MQFVRKLLYICIAMVLVLPAAGFTKESRRAGKKSRLSSSCKPCEKLDGFVSFGKIDDEIRKIVGNYEGGGGAENVAIQKARGVIETYLKPDFINGGTCPEIDSETFEPFNSSKIT